MANPVGKVDENKIEKIMKGPIKQNSEGEVRAATRRSCVSIVGDQGIWPESEEKCTEPVDALNTVYALRKPLSPPLVVRMKFNEKEAKMELDTGAAVSITPESVQLQLFTHSACYGHKLMYSPNVFLVLGRDVYLR
ncbi:hypothetical protein EMCRGX_G024739 [Ephydatia muelleri]